MWTVFFWLFSSRSMIFKFELTYIFRIAFFLQIRPYGLWLIDRRGRKKKRRGNPRGLENIKIPGVAWAPRETQLLRRMSIFYLLIWFSKIIVSCFLFSMTEFILFLPSFSANIQLDIINARFFSSFRFFIFLPFLVLLKRKRNGAG